MLVADVMEIIKDIIVMIVTIITVAESMSQTICEETGAEMVVDVATETDAAADDSNYFLIQLAASIA